MKEALARLFLTIALIVMPAISAAQQLLDPTAHWRVLSTSHFDVVFTPPLEPVARRAASYAESAYAALSAELHPPRGRVSLVIADNVDFTNGFATPVPTNRIVVYATPPLDVQSLRYYDDWMRTVVTHELVHIFHLDRARGIWRFGQYIFGRSPWLMPNLYEPAWMSEGLAVYYESLLTGGGRAQASHQRMLLRAAASGGDFPALNELSLATSRYPGGDIAYGFGGLFLDYLARRSGRASIGRFIEHASGELIPFRLNHIARESFGMSFQSAYEDWSDSIAAAVRASGTVEPEWTLLTHEGRTVAHPRWTSPETLLYSAANGRQTTGLYTVDTAGDPRRLARRNGIDVNAPAPDGGIVFAQMDFVDQYHIRSDIYRARDGDVTRLTTGARLAQPDVRADGAMVAVEGVPGTNRLVILRPDGEIWKALSGASLDTQWAAPRWSPDGARIAVTRWTRGGFADVVILDTAGALSARITADRALDVAPAWLPDGSGIVFASDRAGVSELYLARLEGDEAAEPVRIARAVIGLDQPAVSPDERTLAATVFRADGWHIGITPLSAALDSATASATAPASLTSDPLSPPQPSTAVARDYSPWRWLLPTSWLPLVGETAAGDYSFGGQVNGRDLIGRHSYLLQAYFDPQHAENEYFGSYRYDGLGQPGMSFLGSQEWSRARVVDSASNPVGTLSRRARFASAAFVLSRPRTRTNSFVTVGGQVEWRRYETAPAQLLGALDPFFSSNPEYRSLVATAGFSNTQRPSLSISPEDGISLSLRGQLDWLKGTSGLEGRSTSGAVAAYKSIPAPGYAHHVLALRLAGGKSGGRSPSAFEIGGVSGSSISLLPGVSFGERRSFGVRGFPPASLIGSRALAASAEYRAPLSLLGVGLWTLPAFLNKASVSAFADAATADDEPFFGAITSGRVIAAVGAELSVDVALQYDVPFLLRFGIAAPVQGRELADADPVTVYFRLGSSF
jgi:hypothetical protein